MVKIEVINEFFANSSTILNWSITVTAASFLLILNSSYYKLKGKKKITYLLFFPAWIFIGISIQKYNKITEDIIIIKLLDPKTIDYRHNFIRLTLEVSDLYRSQTQNFYYGIGIITVIISTIIIFLIVEKPDDEKSVELID